MMRRRRPSWHGAARRIGLAGLALVAAVLVGAALPEDDAPSRGAEFRPPGPAAASPNGTAGAGAGAQVLAQLNALRVEAENAAEYDRDSYGPRWADVDENSCNQRDDRLLLDAIPGTVTIAVQGSCDHDVLAGQWTDPYTGELLVATDLKDQAQAQSVTVDHVVALAEAHQSGAYLWSADQKLRYANDLSGLRIVAGDTNSSKSDQDPAEWLPVASAVCWYVAVWIAIKTTWELSVDPAELAALQGVLTGCSK